MSTSAPSFESLRWVWALRDADIPPRLRVLAMIHFSYADAEGKMFPSVETLRLAFTRDDDSPYNEKTIRRARSELVNLGWLTLVNKGVGRGKPSVYRLSFPALKPDIQASENRTLTPPENRTLDVRLSETGREKTSIGVVDGVEGTGLRESAPLLAPPHLTNGHTNGNGSLGLEVDQAHRTASQNLSATTNQNVAGAGTLAGAWSSGDEVARQQLRELVRCVSEQRRRLGLRPQVDGSEVLESLHVELDTHVPQW